MLPYELCLFPGSTQDFLFLDKGPHRAEIFLSTETGSTSGAFFLVDAEYAVTFDDSFCGTDAIPDAGMTLNTFIADFICH